MPYLDETRFAVDELELSMRWAMLDTQRIEHLQLIIDDLGDGAVLSRSGRSNEQSRREELRMTGTNPNGKFFSPQPCPEVDEGRAIDFSLVILLRQDQDAMEREKETASQLTTT